MSNYINDHLTRQSSRLTSDKSVDIERVVIRVLPPPPPVYRHPNAVINFDGFNQNFIADKVIESMHANGNRGHIPMTTFSGVSGGFLRPTLSPTGLIETPDETYGVIWIWVKTKSHSMNSVKYELVCGRFDAQALKFDNMGECIGIYSDVPIRINNVVLLDVQHEYHQGRRDTVERLRFKCASDILADKNYSGFRSPDLTFEQTPSTMFYKHLSDTNQVDDDALVSSTVVTNRAKPVEQMLSSPSAFVSRVANAVIEGDNMSDVDRLVSVPDSDGYNDVETTERNTMISRCATMSSSNVFRKRFAFSDAIDAVTSTGNNLGLFGGNVCWDDILAIAPRFEDFTSNAAHRDVEVHITSDMLRNGSLVSNQRYDHSESPWAETSIEASMAYMLAHNMLAVMGGLGISSVYFHVTNETDTGSWQSQIRGDNSLSYVYGDGQVETINRFLSQVEYEVMPDVVSTGDGYTHDVYAEVYADILGDVEITLSVNGGRSEIYKLPALMTGDTTPSLTNSTTTLKSLSNTVGSIIDTISHRKQRESLDVYRSNISGTTPAGARPKFIR